jgi:hypothetical protein
VVKIGLNWVRFYRGGREGQDGWREQNNGLRGEIE